MESLLTDHRHNTVIMVDDLLLWVGYRRYERTKDSGEWVGASSAREEDALGHEHEN